MTLRFLMSLRYVATGIILLLIAYRPQAAETSSDETAIRESAQAILRAALEKDWDTVLSYYAPDAMVLVPNGPLLTDHAAIRRMWMTTMDANVTERWSSMKIEVARSGELAYEIGTIESTSKDAKNTLHTFTGKSLTVWKKQPDGMWKMVADTRSSDH